MSKTVTYVEVSPLDLRPLNSNLAGLVYGGEELLPFSTRNFTSQLRFKVINVIEVSTQLLV